MNPHILHFQAHWHTLSCSWTGNYVCDIKINKKKQFESNILAIGYILATKILAISNRRNSDSDVTICNFDSKSLHSQIPIYVKHRFYQFEYSTFEKGVFTHNPQWMSIRVCVHMSVEYELYDFQFSPIPDPPRCVRLNWLVLISTEIEFHWMYSVYMPQSIVR